MSTYTVQSAKTQLSRILHDVEQGREAVIARGQTPVARIVAIDGLPRRQFGQMTFEVPDDFDAPLPADELAAWE